MNRNCLLLMAGLAGAAFYSVPSTADACGGTFCDNAPAAMQSPVDQTGETILFVMDEGKVEAHIQIEYDPNTDAEKFAWIVPVMAPPTFAVGSQQLMLNLLNATVPSYGYQNQFDFCGDGDGGGGWDDFGCSGGAAGGDGAGTGGDAPPDGDTTGGGTEVVSKQTVGAFDIVVLTSTSTADLMMWLDDNGFYADPAAEPILDEYLAEGALFAAARLTQGADVGEIHPIVITYEGTEACVPIRLTRIAAKDDMEIRTLFLGDTRIGPRNYRHVELNPVKLDWTGLGDNYKEVVTMAVDEAEGHAFVTEYAGSTAPVPLDGLYSEQWDAVPLVAAQPTTVVDLLVAQGLMDCDGVTCTYNHPLMEGILASVLPVPDAIDPGEFYNCVECFEGLVDMNAWSAADLVEAVESRIIGPGLHAVELLGSYPYLTRMYTTLSPHEMTIDPFFMPAPDLPDVDHTSDIATLTNECSGGQVMSLLDGRSVQLSAFNLWPDVAPEQMPWAERIEDVTDRGAPLVLVDNGPLIDELLLTWNAGASDVDLRPEARTHECGDPHADTDPFGPDGPFDGDGQIDNEQFGNCACRAPAPAGAGWAWILLGLGAGFVSRRRRR